MATTIEQGDPLHDPADMLALRSSIALRNMYALISLAESAKDEKARVAAATELNKMLSIGILNRGTIRAASQVNNIRLTGREADDATRRLADKFAPKPATEVAADAAATLEAITYEEV